VGLCKHFRCSMSSIQGGSLMPYFISDKNAECAGWAVEKDDGEVIGCHQTKQDAIDQMVAVSIAEEMEPGGERRAVNRLTFLNTFNRQLVKGWTITERSWLVRGLLLRLCVKLVRWLLVGSQKTK
jgi:hypothetical protein